jgi:hypothetical protein
LGKSTAELATQYGLACTTIASILHSEAHKRAVCPDQLYRDMRTNGYAKGDSTKLGLKAKR